MNINKLISIHTIVSLPKKTITILHRMLLLFMDITKLLHEYYTSF